MIVIGQSQKLLKIFLSVQQKGLAKGGYFIGDCPDPALADTEPQVLDSLVIQSTLFLNWL